MCNINVYSGMIGQMWLPGQKVILRFFGFTTEVRSYRIAVITALDTVLWSHSKIPVQLVEE